MEPKLPGSGLRTRLLFFVLLTILPMFGLVLLTAADQRSFAAQDAQEDALNLTRNAANIYDQHIDGSRLLLTGIAQVNVVRSQNTTACSAFLADLLAQYPQFSNIYAVNMQGDTVCNGIPTSQALNVEGVDWFEMVKERRAFVISNFRIGLQTRRPIVTLAYPILDETGEMIGAVGAGLTLEWLNEFIQSTELPDNTTVTLIDSEQQILARYPPDHYQIGDQYDNAALVDVVFDNPYGTIEANGVDGKPRLYGYSSLAPQAANVYLIVGIAEETAFQQVNYIERRNLVGLALVSLFAVLIGWFGSGVIVRPVRTLVEATQKIASGELSARVELQPGVAELQQLAATFNEMADSIEQRVQARTEQLQQEIEVRTRMEQQLKASNSELTSFASIASHDLQEPLRKVQSFSSRIESLYADQLGEKGKDYIQRMQSATSRMQRLIDNLLMYSRIGNQQKPFEQVDLNKVLHDVQADLETQFEETQGKIEIADNLPTIEADPLQMYQLFQNLVGNALKFHRQDVPPLVQVYAQPAEAAAMQICVEDNGIGFDPVYVNRIFGMFERLHGRKDYDGTGLGLAICRKIVERHGGNITATSTPGNGATFIVTLPLANPPPIHTPEG